MTSRIPVDSAEAAELRERDAEREREELAARRHDPACRGGWLGEDEEGRPRPCTICRPHLLSRPCLTCNARPEACQANRVHGGRKCCPDCNHGGASHAP